MAADTSMDVDMDIDFTYEEDPEVARLNAEAAAIEARAAETAEAMNGVEEAPEEGEVDLEEAIPSKVHIRGLDTLTTKDIKNFAAEHYSTDLFSGKVQWIDDTSANLVYDTELAGEEALMALSAEEVTDPQELRRAKTLSTHPDIVMYIRQAKASDVKEPGAKDRSRFYLFNPEYDPDNRPRRNGYDRRGAHRAGYRRDRGDGRYSRRSSRDEKPFDVNLYDDKPTPPTQPAADRRESYSSGSEYSRRKVKFDDDLFASKQNGRLRDRSASPTRDGDGRFGFDEEQPPRRTARYRSRTPPRLRASADNKVVLGQLRKELFPEKRPIFETPLASAQSAGKSVELFPNRTSPAPAKKELFPASQPRKELFPSKTTPLHRRQDAKDLHPDEVATAVGRRTNDSQSVPNRAEGRDLFAGISGGPQVESSYGRLQDQPSNNDDTGFSFKGRGGTVIDGSAGFSILGASRERVENPLIKELFPLKSGSGGAVGEKKDLFDGRIKGRGSQRQRAEDMF